MTEVLSQDEINQLLTAIDADDDKPKKQTADGRQIKSYNFKRPNKFSKEQIQTLSIMHETFAILSAASLSTLLQSYVHINTASVDQLTFEEFVRSVPTPTTLAVIDMDPLKGMALMEIDPAATFSIIDRLFGGTGDGTKTQHEITDIEASVMEEVFFKLLGNMREAWTGAADLQPRLAQIDTNPQFVQIVRPTEMVILITLEIKVCDVGGMINICYPYPVMQAVSDKLKAASWYGAKAISDKNNNQTDWDNIPIRMIAEVFRRDYTIKEVCEWKEGKILLPLRPLVPNLCYLKLGDRRVWQCKILNSKLNDQSVEKNGILKQIKIIGYAKKPFETEGIMKMSEANPLVRDALSMAEIKVTAELGSAVMAIKQLLELGENTVVELDKLAGEPVELKANGVLIAKGEVVVIDENFGVRITEIAGSAEKLKT